MDKIVFKNFSVNDYKNVCDFFIELNSSKKHINWNWARWEWMFFHSEFDFSLANNIGLWFDKDKVVGLATYDLYYGEAFCGVLENYKELFPEVLQYAVKTFKDDDGLGIAICGEDKNILLQNGFIPNQNKETVLYFDLNNLTSVEISEEYSIRNINVKKDVSAFHKTLWKGFDHGENVDFSEEELMKSQKMLSAPDFDSDLALFVCNSKGEEVAYCSCWYNKKTDYAYIEPLCVVPEYRGKGIGKAVLFRALEKCREKGATKAFVLSDLDFYSKVGFEFFSEFQFYWIK